MIRAVPFLLLAGCPKGWPTTQSPEFDDAVCLGFAFGTAAAEITQQVVGDRGALPAISVNVSGCLTVPSPLTTCEQRVKYEAWIDWSVRLAEALAAEVNTPDGIVETAAVQIAECP
jgi:hypothetical protein